MNKTQMKAELFAIILLAGLSGTATAHERGYTGHVTSVKPVYETRVENRNVEKRHCNIERPKKSKRVHNAVLGSLIGSFIGNEISDTPGFGTLGAVVGLSLADTYNNEATSCYTVWQPERHKVRSFSYYEVTAHHRGRVLRFKSQHPYQIGEHIRFAR